MWRLAVIIAGALALSATAPAARGYEARVNFQQHCMRCHLADGTGAAGRVPSVRRSLVQFSGLPAGREFMLRVPGVAQSPLTDEDTAALLNWMARNLSDRPLPADFVDYTAAEVGRFRHEPLADVAAARARLVRTAERPRSATRARDPAGR